MFQFQSPQMFSELNGFNKTNADLKARSSDGVEFDLHRALFTVNAPAFPLNPTGASGGSRPTTTNGSGSGTLPKKTSTTTHNSASSTSSNSSTSSVSSATSFASTSDVIELSEPADVLKICFAFVYPKRHPDMEDLTEFKFVLDVAQAVGKYGIYAGVNTCNARLRTFLPAHAMEILLYAIKYDYLKLMNQAIPYLARSPLTDILKQVPTAYMVPWAQYHEGWSSIFKKAMKRIKALPASSITNQCHTSAPTTTTTNSTFSSSSSQPSFAGFGTPFGSVPPTNTNGNASAGHTIGVSGFPAICTSCRCSTLIWVSNLGEIGTVEELKKAVESVIYMGMGLNVGVGVGAVGAGAGTQAGGCGGSHPCCGVPTLGFGQSAFTQFLYTASTAPLAITAATPSTTTGNMSTGGTSAPNQPLFSFSNTNTTTAAQPTSNGAAAAVVPPFTGAPSPFGNFGVFNHTPRTANEISAPTAPAPAPAPASAAPPAFSSLSLTPTLTPTPVQQMASQPLCGHLVNVAKFLKEEIDAVPAFMFLHLASGGNGVANGGGINGGVNGESGGAKGGVVKRVRT